MLETLSTLLAGLGMAEFVASSPWVWPICEILHFAGMALVVGTVGLVDLRIIGAFKGLAIAKLEGLVLWGILGFALNLVTGFVFVTGNAIGGPLAYLSLLSFQLKMLAIAIAGINLLIYYVAGIAPRTNATGPDDDAPALAKVVAAVSLCMWLIVICMGRLLMYNDTLLLSLGL